MVGGGCVGGVFGGGLMELVDVGFVEGFVVVGVLGFFLGVVVEGYFGVVLLGDC